MMFVLSHFLVSISLYLLLIQITESYLDSCAWTCLYCLMKLLKILSLFTFIVDWCCSTLFKTALLFIVFLKSSQIQIVDRVILGWSITMRPLLILPILEMKVIHIKMDNHLIWSPFDFTLLVNALSDWVTLLPTAKYFLTRDSLLAFLICSIEAIDWVHNAVCVGLRVENTTIFIHFAIQFSNNARLFLWDLLFGTNVLIGCNVLGDEH